MTAPERTLRLLLMITLLHSSPLLPTYLQLGFLSGWDTTHRSSVVKYITVQNNNKDEERGRFAV
jgi:hypothetical protein